MKKFKSKWPMNIVHLKKIFYNIIKWFVGQFDDVKFEKKPEREA